MAENEKKFLAVIEEVDVDSQGQVVVAEAPAKEKIVYVDRYIELPAEQPEQEVEETVEQPVEEPVEQPVEEAAEETAVAVEEPEEILDEASEDEEVEVDEFGNVVRYRKSFMARLIQTQNPNQDYYTELKNELLSYKGVKSRLSWKYDSFNKGRKKCAKIAIRGKTLVLYLALDPLDEEKFHPTKYYQFNAGETKCYAEVPFGMKIRSDRALKYAKELIAILMAELGLEKREIVQEDYHYPYETTEQLISEGLIKIIGVGGEAYQGFSTVGETLTQPAEEPAEEEVAAAEAEAFEPEEAAEEPSDEAEPFAAIDAEAKPKYVNKSFAQKMMLADEILQDRYDELKNYALRFKKIKSRISKKFDSFNKGRLQFVKLSVAGKTLKLYLNMDINTADPKFHCKDVSDKKTYEPVPVLLRVKSGRAVKYAKMLIDQCAESHGLTENKKFLGVDAIALVEESLAPKQED